MPPQLIINADDYCRTTNISRGIREAHLHGVVSSTTCMMNFPNAAADIRLALAETPNLGLGVHLVLTAGRPISAPEKIPTLVTSENRFFNLNHLLPRLKGIDPEEVKSEWQAQIDRFVSLTGQAPTHLDSHHHSSYFTAPFFEAMLGLAREYGCAIRQVTTQDGLFLQGLPPQVTENIGEYAPRLLGEFNMRSTDAFYASFYDQQATKKELIDIMEKLPRKGIYEVMCHPGYADETLEVSSSYNHQREQELAVLTDPEIKKTIQSLQIESVTFAAINKHT